MDYNVEIRFSGMCLSVVAGDLPDATSVRVALVDAPGHAQRVTYSWFDAIRPGVRIPDGLLQNIFVDPAGERFAAVDVQGDLGLQDTGRSAGELDSPVLLDDSAVSDDGAEAYKWLLNLRDQGAAAVKLVQGDLRAFVTLQNEGVIGSSNLFSLLNGHPVPRIHIGSKYADDLLYRFQLKGDLVIRCPGGHRLSFPKPLDSSVLKLGISNDPATIDRGPSFDDPVLKHLRHFQRYVVRGQLTTPTEEAQLDTPPGPRCNAVTIAAQFVEWT